MDWFDGAVGGLVGAAAGVVMLEGLRGRPESVHLRDDGDAWIVYVASGADSSDRFRIGSREGGIEGARKLGRELGVPAFDDRGNRLEPRGPPRGPLSSGGDFDLRL